MMIDGIMLLIRALYLLFTNAIRLLVGNLPEINADKVLESPAQHHHSGIIHWEDYLWKYAGRILTAYLLWIGYKIGFTPMNRVKTLTDIGWDHLRQNGVKKHDIANRVREIQRMRKKGDLPPLYPNGWFAIAESRVIAKSEVKSIQCLGETFAVFRKEDGIISVLDAYCPHLGANMGVGGIVKGHSLECPFHGWVFSGQSGSCSHIPYAKKVPEFTKVRRWHSDECNGFIFVWYDAEDRPPLWSVPSYREIEDGEFIYRGRTEHQVLAHIQEIPENGSDLAHLGHLHVPNIMKGADLTNAYTVNKFLDLLCHEWTGAWRSLEAPKEHMAEVSIKHSFSLFGGKLKLIDIKVTAEQVRKGNIYHRYGLILSLASEMKKNLQRWIGPAIVILHFETFLGKAILVQTVTPQEPLRQKLVHQFYSSPTFFTPFAKLVILGEAIHVERDIMIWNSKTYLPKPLLLAEDRLISRFRRWYSQFYSSNSTKFTSFRKDSLEW